MEDQLKEQIATLKLQIGLLQSEVEKWKRRALAANRDRARMEWKELQRIEEATSE
jgi:outer membrane murein-binding lipoprotein Lpp